jgi:hypothetical protein
MDTPLRQRAAHLAVAHRLRAPHEQGLIWIKGQPLAVAVALWAEIRVAHQEGAAMSVNIDDLLPNANEIQKQAALK